MATIDIFIKSYKRDFWLLQLSLQTISKNVTGYNNILLLIPEDEKEFFDTREMPERTLIFYVHEYGQEGSGWYFQQWLKMSAHKYSSADYIMFTDSDCMFDHPVDLQEFIADGKPEILYTSWDKVGDARAWLEPTEKFMKDTVPFEFMRRNQLIYHRSTLIRISEYAPDLEKTIMSSEHFSEFNCIGAFAYKYERHMYNFINTDDWQYVPPKAIQVWSHASKEEGADDLHIREYIRVLESILIAFGVKVP